MKRIKRVCIFCLIFFVLAVAPGVAANELKIVYNAGVAPLKFDDLAGQPAGLFPDLWRLWAQKTGQKIRFIKAETFEASLQMVKGGRADLHAGLFRTPEREAYLDFSEPLLQLDYHLFTHPSIYPIDTLERTSGMLVGLTKGGFTERYLRSHLPASRLVIYDDYESLFRAALEGEVKVFVATKLSLFYFIKENLLFNIFEVDDQKPLFSQTYYTASMKSDSTLIQTVNQGLGAIGNEDRRRLEDKWVVRESEESEDDKISDSTIDWTAEERAWLQANPIIRFTGDPDWLPQEAFTNDGMHTGIVADILKLIENRSGIVFERVPVKTWTEAVRLAETGMVDVLSETTSSERDALIFTESYLDFPVVILAKQGVRPVSDPGELKGKRLAVVKGYGYVIPFRRQHPDLSYVEVETVRDGLMRLSTGDVDAFISAAPTAFHLMSEYGLTNLNVIGFTGFSIDLGFGVRKDAPILVGILNKALADIPDEEKLGIRQKWVPVIESSSPQMAARFSYTRLIVYGVAVFLILSLLAWTLIKFIQKEKIAVQFGSRWFRGLVLIGLSFFVIIVSLLGWFVLSQNEENVKAASGEYLRELLRTADDRLNLWVDQRKSFMKFLGKDPELVNLTKRLLTVEPVRDGLLASDALQHARAYFKNHNDIIQNLGFFIINKDHVSIGSMRDGNVGTRNLISLQRPDLIERAFKGEVLFVPPIESDVPLQNLTAVTEGKPAYTQFFIGPVEDSNGQIIAVMTLRVDPSQDFSKLLPAPQSLMTAETIAFTDKGLLLSESRFDDQLRRIGLLGEGQESALNIEIRDPGSNLVDNPLSAGQRSKKPLTRMAAGVNQLKKDMEMTGRVDGRSKIEIDISGYRDYRGVPVFGAWLWSADLGLGLASEVDVAETLSNHRRIQRTVLGILAVTLLMSVGATIMVLLFGERTSQALLKARDELELRVRERTAELRKLSRATENSPASVVITDKKGNIEYVNPTFSEVTGYSAEEVIGQNPRVLKSGNLPDQYYKELWETILSGRVWRGEFINRRKNGKDFWESASLSPILNDQGEITHFVAVKQDITERKRMEQEILAAKEKAEEATKAKGDFLANMSHEIRTPMNAVIGMTHLALKTELTPKQNDYLSKIKSSANSLLGIINDILDFSKIEAGKLDMEAVEFNLDDVLDNLANLVTVKAREKEELEVLFATAQDVPRHLVGDPLRLGQVLTNLANNSVKFTDSGEIVVATELVNRDDDAISLKFSVRDTGIGLTDEQIETLFESFSQADTSTTRKYGGTGLGLSISRRLVEMMDGSIWAESEKGKGSTFSFVAKFGIGEQKLKKRFEASQELKGMRVLVVDDNRTSRNILQDMLESFSFEVLLATTGEDGLEEIEKADLQKPIDLVLMDWKMPGMDGLETSRRIKTHPHLNKIPPVVLVTAYGREELMQRSERLGLEGFLIKPVNPSVLFDTIMDALGQKTVSVPRGKAIVPEIGIENIQGAHVLLAEDNEINQQVALEVLQGAGLKVTVVNNGLEAVNAVKANRFDAVLMDIQMPVMDGYTATREIRNSKSEIRNIPILAMTAHAMSGDEEKSLQAGMNGHITKPIDPDKLFDVLAQWIKPTLETVETYEPNAAGRDATVVEALPESLAGFDLAAGLKRLGGNRKLYRKLLVDFGTQYTRTAGEIRKALDANDFEQAHSLVHNLKGLAGNLEATDLLDATLEMEGMVKAGTDKAPTSVKIADSFLKLNETLMQALTAAQSLGPASPTESAAASKDAYDLRPSDLGKAAVDQILAAADIGDVTQIAAIAESLQTDNKELAPLCGKISRLANDFDLEGIRKLLKGAGD